MRTGINAFVSFDVKLEKEKSARLTMNYSTTCSNDLTIQRDNVKGFSLIFCFVFVFV